jgi:hypothetical protein
VQTFQEALREAVERDVEPRFGEGEVPVVEDEEAKPAAKPMALFDHQKKAFTDILAMATVLFEGRWRALPVRPRFNLLLTGETGLGKTQVVRAVAEAIGLPLFEVSTATWILVGTSGRGAVATWPSLLEFLLTNRLGLIFIDEIDKVIGRGEWSTFLRTELYSLLDRTIPSDLVKASALSEQNEAECQRNMRIARGIAGLRLRYGMLIVAAGAFQELLEGRDSRPLGFGATKAPLKEKAPDLPLLSQWLPRELSNRFSPRVLHLGPLTLSAYLRMLYQTAQRLPEDLQNQFIERGCDSVLAAREARLGVRWLEDLVTETLVAIPPADRASGR